MQRNFKIVLKRPPKEHFDTVKLISQIKLSTAGNKTSGLIEILNKTTGKMKTNCYKTVLLVFCNKGDYKKIFFYLSAENDAKIIKWLLLTTC